MVDALLTLSKIAKASSFQLATWNMAAQQWEGDGGSEDREPALAQPERNVGAVPELPTPVGQRSMIAGQEIARTWSTAQTNTQSGCAEMRIHRRAHRLPRAGSWRHGSNQNRKEETPIGVSSPGAPMVSQRQVTEMLNVTEQAW